MFKDGTRIRVTKPTTIYKDFEATKSGGKLPVGTEGTVVVGQSFRGKVSIVTTTGIFACVSWFCLEQIDAPPSAVVSSTGFLDPVQTPEKLQMDDVYLLLSYLTSPYRDTRQNAAVALTHAFCNGLLASLDDVRVAITSGAILFGPVAAVLLSHARRETIDSLLADLENAPAEIRDQALTEWAQIANSDAASNDPEAE